MYTRRAVRIFGIGCFKEAVSVLIDQAFVNFSGNNGLIQPEI